MSSAVAKHTEFSLLADLAAAGGVTDTSLYLEPGTSYEQWVAVGVMLNHCNDFDKKTLPWLIADWLAFGEHYGEEYAQGVDDALGNLAPSTLSNYASVARHIPPERRRATLSYSHHAVVAYMPREEQEHWLEQAETAGWSRRELEQHVKGAEEPERHNCPDCGREHVVQT